MAHSQKKDSTEHTWCTDHHIAIALTTDVSIQNIKLTDTRAFDTSDYNAQRKATNQPQPNQTQKYSTYLSYAFICVYLYIIFAGRRIVGGWLCGGSLLHI